MEILILIGIFAFVVAILFRSNEALDRVGDVEKEVKTIEEEIKHTEPLAEKGKEVEQSLAAAGDPVVTPEPASCPVEVSMESVSASSERAQCETPSVPLAETGPVDGTLTFPKTENVHMNQ